MVRGRAAEAWKFQGIEPKVMFRTISVMSSKYTTTSFHETSNAQNFSRKEKILYTPSISHFYIIWKRFSEEP